VAGDGGDNSPSVSFVKTYRVFLNDDDNMWLTRYLLGIASNRWPEEIAGGLRYYHIEK